MILFLKFSFTGSVNSILFDNFLIFISVYFQIADLYWVVFLKF